MKFLNKLKSWFVYAPVVSFLSLEIIAFTIFSFGDSYILYSVLGIAILLLLGLMTFWQLKKENVSTYIIFAMPILVYGLIAVLSSYSASSVGLAERVFVPITLLVFVTSGYLVSRLPSFKIKHLLFTLNSVLALITFLNFVMTLMQYGAFYTIKYSYYHTYYDGTVSRVALNQTAYGLISFHFESITIQYFSLFPSLLLTSAIGLFFISPKEKKKEFISLCLFTLLALLALIFTVSKVMLVADILTILVIGLIVVFAKFDKLRNKVSKIILLIFLLLFILLVVFIICNANGVGFVNKITHSNGFFNYVFNENKLISDINYILDGMFTKEKLFGFAPYIVNYANDYVIYPSGNWLFDSIMYGGFFLFIFFILFLIIACKGTINYLKSNRDNQVEKILLFALVVEYFVYTFINGSVLRMVNFYNQLPLYLSGPFLVIIFILGYMYSIGMKGETNE